MATWENPNVVAPAPGHTDVYVGYYPSHFKEEDVLYLFRLYGAFKCIERGQWKTRAGRNCILTFATPAEANAAVQAMNGKTLAGKQIKVERTDPTRYVQRGLGSQYDGSTLHGVPDYAMRDNLRLRGNRNSPGNQKVIKMDSALRDRLYKIKRLREHGPEAGSEQQWIKQTAKTYLEIMKLITDILIQFIRLEPGLEDQIPLEDYDDHLRRINLVQFQFDHGMVETLDQNSFMPVFRVMCKTFWKAIRHYYRIKGTPLEYYLPVVQHIYHDLDLFMMKFDLYERL